MKQDMTNQLHSKNSEIPIFISGASSMIGVESICKAAWGGLKRGDTRVDTNNKPHALVRLGNSDPQVMANALALLVDRYSILSTRIEERNDSPWIVPASSVELNWLDVAPEFGESGKDAAERAIGCAVWAPIDHNKGPLARAFALSFAGDFWFGIVLHHFIADAASINVLIADFIRIHMAVLSRSSLSRMTPQLTYQDYLFGLNTWIRGPVGSSLRDVAVSRLIGMPLLSFDQRDRETVEEHFILDPDVSVGIGAIARRLSVSPCIILIAAQNAVLAPNSSNGQVPIKIITSGREISSLLRTIGNLADRQFVVTDMNAVGDFPEIVRRTREALTIARKMSFVRSDFVIADLASRDMQAAAPVFNFRRVHTLMPAADKQADTLHVPLSNGRPTLPRDDYYLNIISAQNEYSGTIRYGAGRLPGFLEKIEEVIRNAYLKLND